MTINTALIGAGIMGGAIGMRLCDMHVPLQVFDLDAEKLAPLIANGATAADTAAQAASRANIIILSLNNAAIVRAAVFGAKGVAEGAKPGTLIVDMSSIDPTSTREMAEMAAETGLRWLDCPLSGGAPKVATGELTVMAGGEQTDFDAVRPVMELLCANFTLMGGTGAGQATKMINQVLGGIGFQAVAEATHLALLNGVDATKVPAAIFGGRADSALVQEYMAKMARHDYSPTGRLDNMVKDLDAALHMAQASGAALPVTQMVTNIHRKLVEDGHGADDNAALMRQFTK